MISSLRWPYQIIVTLCTPKLEFYDWVMFWKGGKQMNTSRWLSLWSRRCRRWVVMLLATDSSSSGCTSVDSNHCRSRMFSWLWVNWGTWQRAVRAAGRTAIWLLTYCIVNMNRSTSECKQSEPGTSWMCAAMAAFVSKSSVWILAMYSSFFSHWAQNTNRFRSPKLRWNVLYFLNKRVFKFSLYLDRTAQQQQQECLDLLQTLFCGDFVLFFLKQKKVTIWNKTYLIRAVGAAGMDLRGNEHELVNLGQSGNITSQSSYQTDRVQLNLSGLRKNHGCLCCQNFKTSVGRKFHLLLRQ